MHTLLSLVFDFGVDLSKIYFKMSAIEFYEYKSVVHAMKTFGNSVPIEIQRFNFIGSLLISIK